MTPKKNILIDMDGTIITSAPGVMRCINHTLVHYGIHEQPTDILRKCCGPPLSSTFRDRFALPEESIAEAVSYYRQEYNARGIFECDLFPGMKECLTTLKDMGYDLVVASSKHEAACHRILEHFGIEDLFFAVVGSSGDVSRETKTEVIEAFYELHPDRKKEDSILIGDTIYDAEGAKNAGIDFAAVSYGYGDEDELNMTDALAIIESPEKIVDYLETLTK